MGFERLETVEGLRLLTTQDMADLFGITVNGVYHAVTEGRLPRPIRIGERTMRWAERDVLEYLNSRRLDAAS